ncbi:MAG: hypothetical protein JKY37_14930 [Nannocystaceae bacterium]|nr:hypothetical protein [Nannocystaceae bacterium]
MMAALALMGALAFAPGPGPAPGAEPSAAADAKEPIEAAVDGAGRVVSDGPVAVSVRVTPEPSYIGDVLQLHVVAAYPKKVSVNLPIGLSFEPLHLVGIEEAPPEATGEGLRKTFTIKLQYFDVGTGRIPGFPVTWVDEGGEVHTLEVPARTFEVSALLANEADPSRRDEDPPVSLVYPNTTAEIVIYAAFGTLILAFLLWLFGRRFFGRPKPVYVPPPIPAHEVALSALEELERGELVADGRLSDYYLTLTQIAKGYIEGRFGVDALDRTTEEIRAELLANPERIEPLSADDVVEFLMACDLVKFARFDPPVEEAEEALGNVRGMVEASLPAAKSGSATPATASSDSPPSAVQATSEDEAEGPGSDKAESDKADSDKADSDKETPQ